MEQIKKGPYIGILTIFLALSAYLSFAAASLSMDSGSDIVSDVKKILTEIAVYDYGQSRESLSGLRELVNASLDSPDLTVQIEKEMIAFLKSDATFAGKATGRWGRLLKPVLRARGQRKVRTFARIAVSFVCR